MASLGFAGASGGLAVAAGRAVVAGHLQQVGSYGQEVVDATMRSSAEGVEYGEPGRWPRTIASATARLSVAIGLGARAPAAVEGQDLRPVGGFGGWCPVVDGSDGGLQLVRAERPGRQGASHEGHAFGDGIQRPRASGPARLSGTSDPSGAVRAGRRASVNSMRARSPATSLLPGTTGGPWRASRMASAVNSARTSSRPRGGRVALVEDEVEHVDHDAEPLRLLGLAAARRWLRLP